MNTISNYSAASLPPPLGSGQPADGKVEPEGTDHVYVAQMRSVSTQGAGPQVGPPGRAGGRALSSRPGGNALVQPGQAVTQPRFGSFSELNDVKYPPMSIHGITTRGGEHYVRIEGQVTPERVHYDAQGRMLAENGDGLAQASAGSPDVAFKRVRVTEAPPGPMPFSWPQRSRLLPGADYSRAWTSALGQPDNIGMFHIKGRRYVELDGQPGIGVEVGSGTDGKLRIVMDDDGKPTGPAVSKGEGRMAYRSDPATYGTRDADASVDDPSRFYVSPDDQTIIQRDRSGEDVSPTDLAAAQERVRQKGIALRDAAYKDLPGALRPPLPPVDLPERPSDPQIIDAAFAGARGLVVGENHYRKDAVEFLERNLDYLRKQGVDTLFLEYDRETLPRLNAVLMLDGETTQDPELRAQWDAARRNLGPKFDLLHKAVKSGIQLKPVDSWTAGLDGNGTMSPQTRKAAMNHLAQMEINKHQSEHGGKWIALVGSGHASDHVVDGVNIPGVASTTGTRSISFFHRRPGAATAQQRTVSANASFVETYGFQSRPDIIVDTPNRP